MGTLLVTVSLQDLPKLLYLVVLEENLAVLQPIEICVFRHFHSAFRDRASSETLTSRFEIRLPAGDIREGEVL